jgi:hypothetical protein
MFSRINFYINGGCEAVDEIMGSVLQPTAQTSNLESNTGPVLL